MNIFILDNDPNKCAMYHCDKHVVKMITEHAQMLSTAVRLSGFDYGYNITHQNHPCTKWARESLSNWYWLLNLTKYLHDEWQYRYNHSVSKLHKAWQVIEELPEPEIEDIGLTPFALAMPDQYKSNNAVEAYRDYYFGDKQHIASWKKRGEPGWFTKRKINVDLIA